MDKKIKKQKNLIKDKKIDLDKPIPKNRLAFFKVVSFLLLVCLVGRLGWWQIINGAELKEKASRQQTINEVISPKRGSIYDTNGKALAISAAVDTVSVNPSKIDSKDKEKIAKALSDIFELNYDETLSKLNNNSSIVTIAKKVEHDKVTALKTWMSDNNISSGINIDEDTKRYYPYDSLASHVIGFMGTDKGLYGIESRWDSTLTGVPGKIVTTADVNHSEISSDASQYVEVENGSDLYLTIDVNIQSIVEKYLEKGVSKAKASAGSAIAMDPNTGDILAMATYPYYNLNDPFTLTSTYDTSTMTNEEKNNALYEMWSDKNITATYEPGSTFKTIISAIALEENITETEIANDFNCTGFIEVADRKIRCASHEVHGNQTLKQALSNSCNVGFVSLGQRIGVDTLYKYFRAFGLFEKTGISITGEYSSVFHDKNSIGPVELATTSFGQRFEITPLQLVTAVSSIANEGKLMQPRIVKQVISKDGDSKNVTNIEPTTIRTVISKETAEQVCNMMEAVVTDGGGKKGAVQGYTIGGKTGTAESTYSKGSSYGISSVSFVAVAPSNDAEIVLLVILYEPQTSSAFGSTLAAPIASDMLSEILPYLGIASEDSSNNTSTSNQLVSVPDVTNKTLTEAIKTLKNAGLKVSYSDVADSNSTLVKEQVPAANTSLYKNSTIALYTNKNSVRTSVTVPDLTGYTLAQARSILSNLNLNLKYIGSGIIASQDIAKDTSVEEGSIITVTLK